MVRVRYVVEHEQRAAEAAEPAERLDLPETLVVPDPDDPERPAVDRDRLDLRGPERGRHAEAGSHRDPGRDQPAEDR